MSKDGSGCLPRIGKRAPAFTTTFIEDRHVVEGPRHVGMARAERMLPDCQCSLEERLSLFVFALVLINERQAVEFQSDLRVIRTKRLFADDQRALVQSLRLPILALVSIHVS